MSLRAQMGLTILFMVISIIMTVLGFGSFALIQLVNFFVSITAVNYSGMLLAVGIAGFFGAMFCLFQENKITNDLT